MNKKGFTLVEVSLFIALSGAIFLAAILGTNGAISRQRYNDSVQNFYDFLVNVYAKTINVENSDGTGQADTAIYGKMVTFTGDEPDNYNIKIYDITADAEMRQYESPIELIDAKAHTSDMTDYHPMWGAKINKDQNGDLFTGSIIMIRSSNSGSISTYFSPDTSNNLQNVFDKAYATEINFCIDSDNRGTSESANIRIAKNGINASAIQWVTDEGEEGSICR